MLFLSSLLIVPSPVRADMSSYVIEFAKGNYQLVIDQLQKVAVDKKELGKKEYLLAMSFSRLQEYDKANLHFKSSIDQNYDAEDLHYEFGQSLYAANELKSAQLAFIRSYRKHFKTPACLYYIGHIFQILEEYEDAKEFYLTLTVEDVADDNTLQIAHQQVAEMDLLLAKNNELSKTEMTKLIDKTIIPRLQLAIKAAPTTPLAAEIKAKIANYLIEYRLDPDLLENGRRMPAKRYTLYALQKMKYDDNVTLTNEENNVSQSMKPSLISESEIFGRFDFYLKKKYIISPELRLNFLKYSDQSSPEVYQNDSSGIYFNIRSKYEHLYDNQPASFLADIEYSSTKKDWHYVHVQEPYAKTLALGIGEMIRLFSFGDSSFKFKFKKFAGANELISNHSYSFSADQTIFLPRQQLLLLLIDYSSVNNFNNTFSNTNTLLARVDYLSLHFLPSYNLGVAFAVSYVDTLKQKATRGTEMLMNPSFNISKELNDFWNLSFNFDYSQNKSKVIEYSYKKKVYSLELRYAL